MMAQQIEDNIPNEVFTNVSLHSNPDLSKSDPIIESENYVEQVTEITQTKDKKSNSLKRFFHRKTGKVCSSESLADDSSINPDEECPKRDSLSKRFRNMRVGSYFSARQEKEKQTMESPNSASQQEKSARRQHFVRKRAQFKTMRKPKVIMVPNNEVQSDGSDIVQPRREIGQMDLRILSAAEQLFSIDVNFNRSVESKSGTSSLDSN